MSTYSYYETKFSRELSLLGTGGYASVYKYKNKNKVLKLFHGKNSFAPIFYEFSKNNNKVKYLPKVYSMKKLNEEIYTVCLPKYNPLLQYDDEELLYDFVDNLFYQMYEGLNIETLKKCCSNILKLNINVQHLAYTIETIRNLAFTNWDIVKQNTSDHIRLELEKGFCPNDICSNNIMVNPITDELVFTDPLI